MMHRTSINGDGRQESGLKVLVVDSYPDAADSLALLLKRYGYTVEVAYSGREALEVARAFRPAVLISEIILPHLDGYQFAQQLRAEFRDTWLITLTTMDRGADRSRSRDAGFDFHLLKPADPSEIQHLLQMISLKSSPAAGDDSESELAHPSQCEVFPSAVA